MIQPTPQLTVSELFAALNGTVIPGGCDTCDAEQAIERKGGITHITIHHDDTCPTWRRIQARRGRTDDRP